MFIQGNNTFNIRPMNPFDAIVLMGDLQKMVLPAVGDAFSAKQGTKNAKEVADMAVDFFDKDIDLANVIKTFSSSFDGAQLQTMLEKILNCEFITVKIGSAAEQRMDKAMLLQLYTGNPFGMFELAWEVLKVNYRDFFTQLAALFGNLQFAKKE